MPELPEDYAIDPAILDDHVRFVDEPTARVRHGYVISKVPLALLKPGDRKLLVSPKEHLGVNKQELIEVRVQVRPGRTRRTAEVIRIAYYVANALLFT